MLHKPTTIVLALLAGAARVSLAKPTTSPPHNPQVEIKNGTLRGLYLPAFQEDLFLGVPTVVGAGGIERVFELSLDAAEMQALKTSGAGVREMIEELALDSVA